jgi:hypothetical protein
VLAILRYQFAILGHSQRYLPPVLLYLVLLATQYTEPRSPLPPEYAVSAGAMTVLACWLTVTTVGVERPAQRLITLSHARRPGAVLAGLIGTVLLCCLALTAVSLAWSLAVHSGGRATDVAIGAVVHLAGALTGIAVGLPCSALLIDRIGWSTICAVAGLLVVLLVPWVPVINPALRARSGITAPALGAVAPSAIAGVVLVGLSAVVVLAVERRRR